MPEDTIQQVREKWYLKSRTLWGGLIAFAPVIIDTFGGGGIQDIPWIADAGLKIIDSANEIVGVLIVAAARYSDGGTQAARLTLRRP